MLTLAEKAELMSELCALPDDDWDRQMKADAASGKFDALNKRAAAEHGAGECPPLECHL